MCPISMEFVSGVRLPAIYESPKLSSESGLPWSSVVKPLKAEWVPGFCSQTWVKP